MIDFLYQDYNRRMATCGLTVLDSEIFGKVVVATELAKNEGMSVTNSWPLVGSHVYRAMFAGKVAPGNILWIEQYNEGSYSETTRPGAFASGEFTIVELIWDKTSSEYVFPAWHAWRPAVNHLEKFLIKSMKNLAPPG